MVDYPYYVLIAPLWKELINGLSSSFESCRHFDQANCNFIFVETAAVLYNYHVSLREIKGS